MVHRDDDCRSLTISVRLAQMAVEEAMAIVPALHIGRDQVQLAWDPAVPPVATVASGSIVEVDCLDSSNGQLTASSTVEDLDRLDFDRVDQLHGPVAVAGIEPGDTLQVDLLEFVPADWGWTASAPGFTGVLGDLAIEVTTGACSRPRLGDGQRAGCRRSRGAAGSPGFRRCPMWTARSSTAGPG